MEIGPVNNYGLTDMMLNGITRKKDALLKSAHPLEISDRKYEDNVLQGELDMITKTQGRAAPFALAWNSRRRPKWGTFPSCPIGIILVGMFFLIGTRPFLSRMSWVDLSTAKEASICLMPVWKNNWESCKTELYL
ncbi:unnamed protein product [Lepeophtheirus salmonis]|uniref:(salmon louse) hypothetical protein n=1 Tax=Lepeophtheirus salmonis TaxID=72036 RepID=A0A7R8GZX1_LEPSM|nr:unnamed protein product [Lepeophtheirus salmonis]CAF2772780.1 unnamed protein product [Lepeophtheirus salmonis]